MGKPILPSWQQDNYAFYQSDGSTQVGTANTQTTLDADTTYYLAVTISDTLANDTYACTIQWQYNLAGGGWNTITTTSPVAFATGSLTDGSTSQNSSAIAGIGTFRGSRVYESAATGATCWSTSGDESDQHGEAWLGFTIDSAQVSNGQEVLIRAVEGNGTVFGGTYTNADIDAAVPIPPDACLADDLQLSVNTSQPALGEIHMLLADDLQSSINTSQPSLMELVELLADDLQLSTTTTQPSLGVITNLAANDLDATTQISTPNAGQIVALLADDLQSAVEVSAPALMERVDLLADDLQLSINTTQPSVVEVTALFADDLEHITQVSTPGVGQSHGLAANDLDASAQVSTPSLAQTGSASARSLEVVAQISTPSVGQIHTLLANDSELAIRVTRPSFGGTADALTGRPLTLSITVTQPSAGVIHNLSARSLATGGVGGGGEGWYDLDDPVTIAQVADEVIAKMNLERTLNRVVQGAIPAPPSNAVIAQELARLMPIPKDTTKELRAIEQRIAKLAKAQPTSKPLQDLSQQVRLMQTDLTPVLESVAKTQAAIQAESARIIENMPKIPRAESYKTELAGISAALSNVQRELEAGFSDISEEIGQIPETDVSQLVTKAELNALKSLVGKLSNYDDTDLEQTLKSLIYTVSDQADRVERKADLLLDSLMR